MTTLDLVSARLLEVTDHAGLINALGEAAGVLDHGNFGAFFRIDDADNERAGAPAYHREWNNLPPAYVAYHDKAQWRGDPVMQRVRTGQLPVFWGESDYVQAGFAPHWEEMASHGIASGILVALHLPRGRHFCLGIDRPDKRPLPPHVAKRHASDLLLIAVHALAATEPLCEAEHAADLGPTLTPRELEALRWVVGGKTNWEISVIMNLAEKTVHHHLERVIKKLGAANRAHAAVLAVRRGLIL